MQKRWSHPILAESEADECEDPQRCTEVRDVWRGALHFHFRSSLVGVIRLGILDCFYQSTKNGVVGSRWSPERMCTVDFSMATSRTQYLTPLGIEGLPLVLQMLAERTDHSFLLPGCCNVRLLLHRHSLQDEIVNLSPYQLCVKICYVSAVLGKLTIQTHCPRNPSFSVCVCCFFIFLERSVPKVCRSWNCVSQFYLLTVIFARDCSENKD